MVEIPSKYFLLDPIPHEEVAVFLLEGPKQGYLSIYNEDSVDRASKNFSEGMCQLFSILKD